MVKLSEIYPKYGAYLGGLILALSVLIYMYIYGRAVRILRKLEPKYVAMMLLNSYLFGLGLFIILTLEGVI